jgi:acetylornithine/N-succinyldiaminopimelate aminotransferase
MDNVIWMSGHERLLDDIVRAANCSLYDAQGKRYVDLESGVWCTPVGHAHPEVLRAMAEQAARIAHVGFCYGNARVREAAAAVLDLHGMAGGQCIFLCSGSEAVEYGVRVAQTLSDRPLLMTMHDSYFGAYGSAHRRESSAWFSFDWRACARCDHADACDAACGHWAAIPFERIGGFLFEPGSSSGLVRFPPDKLIRAIVRKIKEREGLVLVNEVTTGMGRTGEWFGYQHYGLVPDIVAMGKGLGNGYPVSATALAAPVAERLGARPVPYALSHMNDPLGAVVARTVIDIIRGKGLVERGREMGALLAEGLAGIQAASGKIRAIRWRGPMLAVDLHDDEQAGRTTRIHRALVRRGYVLAQRPGLNVLRLDPALTIDKADLEGFLKVLAEMLADGE